MKSDSSNEEQGRFIAKQRIQQGLTQEMVADALGVDTGTVARWERGAQQIRARNLASLAKVLGISLEELNESHSESDLTASQVQHPSSRDLRTVEMVSWLADASGRPFDDTYLAVAQAADQLEHESAALKHARDHARSRIGREHLAAAVVDYYQPEEGSLYTATVAGKPITLTILVDEKWRGLNVDLRDNAGLESSFSSVTAGRSGLYNDETFSAAVARLADAEVNDRVIVNNPMYRLASFEVAADRLQTAFSLSSFADFALRNGLMELELIDALASQPDRELAAGLAQPVRDSLLPSVDATRDLSSHYCSGGPVALFAAARPASANHPADYALLVQKRGKKVMDIPGKLSTIPKGWHQPVSEPASELYLGSTLLREFEEELLGREDLEQVAEGSRRLADPFHNKRHPEAMLPLLEDPSALDIRCTGFGLNLLSGTYEVASLIVINDETWWSTWGHLIAGNWETNSIDCYSSADADGLAALIHDPRWSNEGLFALLEGLRCLRDLGGVDRVADMPSSAD